MNSCLTHARLAVLVALALMLAGCGRGDPVAAPRVQSDGETLTGAPGERYPQVASFKGIPFAAPPVGALRWQAPQPHAPRSGIQPAVAFASACFQDSYNTDWYRRVGAAFGARGSRFIEPSVSEDCLYLNVWTPALDADAMLPVMVWFYGGSNLAGWSYEPNYRGERLAARGNVVVVTIAYRVGIFGFFAHPELRGSPAPANFGLLDQIAALRWVRDNIAAFGGDADNVTAFGESAGAADIGYLMTSPAAAGLFQRAISQSGGFQMRYDFDLHDAERVGVALAQALPGQPRLAVMREIPSAQILAAAKTASLGDDPFRPVIDGFVVTRSPAEAYGRDGLRYDLLIGTNEDEWYMYVDADPAQLDTTLRNLPEEAREQLAQRAAQEADTQHGHDKVTTFVEMVCPAYLMAESVTRSGRHAWVYRFTRVRPGPGGKQLGAYHGAEIPYVFDTHDDWFTGDDVDVELTRAMLGYWSNFARRGDPNDAELEDWPAFDPAAPRVLELGDRIAPLAAPDASLCEELAPSLYPGWRSN